MRGLAQLVRVVAQRAHLADLMGSTMLYAAPGMLITQLTNLRALQWQASASLSAYKRPPREEDEEDTAEVVQAGRKGHLPRVKGPALLSRVPAERLSDAVDDQVASVERLARIRQLLDSGASGKDATGAAKFVDEFFSTARPAVRSYTDMPPHLAAATGGGDGDSDDESGPASERFEISTPAALNEDQEEVLLADLKGLRKSSQRSVLQKLLQGGMLRADPQAMAEWEQIQKAFQPPEGFRMKVVDVNRTCKGSRSGGLYRFSTMVVVGNGEGVLGWGQGKATEVQDAVKKAYHRACRNLYPVPRHNGHTIPERGEAKFGKVKVVMYPKSSGRGIVASVLVADICKMAGIHDIGVKVHGSRNPRNTVKCLFEVFDKMKTGEEILAAAGAGGRMLLPVAPGRFGRLSVEATLVGVLPA